MTGRFSQHRQTEGKLFQHHPHLFVDSCVKCLNSSWMVMPLIYISSSTFWEIISPKPLMIINGGKVKVKLVFHVLRFVMRFCVVLWFHTIHQQSTARVSTLFHDTHVCVTFKALESIAVADYSRSTTDSALLLQGRQDGAWLTSGPQLMSQCGEID